MPDRAVFNPTLVVVIHPANLILRRSYRCHAGYTRDGLVRGHDGVSGSLRPTIYADFKRWRDVTARTRNARPYTNVGLSTSRRFIPVMGWCVDMTACRGSHALQFTPISNVTLA